MPTWNELDAKIRAAEEEGTDAQKFCDELRKAHLAELSAYTSRPAIAYYSGFLQKPPHPEHGVTDFDMNGFMAVVHNLDRMSGLDIVLHTPGGGIESTRAIVEYLYAMFDKDIRVIVPQLAMSCGTMIACAARTIVLGKHSSLGPTDPQIHGQPAMGVVEEIKTALAEIAKEPQRLLVWQEVFRKYPPSFISNCERAIAGTRGMVEGWLAGNMFANQKDPMLSAKKTTSELMNYKDTSEHGHHFMKQKCKDVGLLVEDLEADQKLQEIVLTVHHGYVASFARSRSIKFIENSNGSSWNVAGA